MKLLKTFWKLIAPKTKTPQRLIDKAFKKDLVSEELEITRLGGSILSLRVKGRSVYIVPPDEHQCQIVYDPSMGQHFLVKEVLGVADDTNFCHVTVRFISTLEVKDILLAKHFLYYTESK